MAPVRRIEQFPQTRIAGREIGRDAHGRRAACIALTDIEGGERLARCFQNMRRGDASRRRRFRGERPQERVDVALRTLDVDLDPFRSVFHPAGETVTMRDPVGERPEADALNDPANANYPGVM